MPIDPNIALGVRPIEQPNMLGQMGQFMQLRQMQQANEEQNALRNFYAGGGNASTPEGRRQLMMSSPTAAPKILKQQGEIEAQDLKTGADSLKLLKENVGMVNSPQEMSAYLQNAANTPGGRLLFGLVPLDKAISSIPSDPKAFEAYKRNFSLTADKLFVDANTMANNAQSNINNQRTVGASMYGHNVSAKNAANILDFNKQKRSVIPIEGGFGTTGYKGDILPVTGYGETPAAVSANDLARQVAPQQTAGNVNAFNAPPATGAPISVTAAPAAAPAPANVPRPPMTAVQQKEKGIVEKLPEAIAMNKSAISKINEMIGGVDAEGKPLAGKAGQEHPGLSKATGFGGGAMRFFSGTEGKNFEIRHNEVLSQAFLDAFEALKGGGAITEKEGEKATAARTRMNLAQDKQEYMTAAREYQGVLQRGIANAEKKLQQSGGGALPAAAKTITRTGTIDGRKVVQYSDGSVDYGD